MSETDAYRPDQGQLAAGNSDASPPRIAAGRSESETPAAASSAPPDDIPADLIDHSRYRILKKLGSGGMGTVYHAEHTLMHRPVALKVIRTELTAQPRLVERFRREVRLAAELAHPNIVTAYDAEQSGSCHFLVMEFVEGIDLARLLKERGPLPISEACDYARQAALGLQLAQERQMVHRDIKPSNLLRSLQGQVKIADFGLAHVAQSSPEDQAAVTESGVVLGTPDYMAPEQANDPSRTDSRADIYSLGCTLYELLVGRVPFPGGGMLDKLMRHAKETPVPLDQLRPHLPPPLVQVVERMMAKAPAARYQTAAEVAEALTPWCHPLSETVAWSRPRRTRARVLRGTCALAALLLGVGGMVYLALHNPSGGTGDGDGKPDAQPPTTGRKGPGPPDLTKLRQVFDDDFADPATARSVLSLGKPVPTAKAPVVFGHSGAKLFYQNHRLIIQLLTGELDPPIVNGLAPPPHRQNSDFACLARCTFTGQGDVGWALLHSDGGRYAIAVSVLRAGEVEVAEWDALDRATLRTSKYGNFPLPAKDSGGESTALLVTLQGRKLTVFVNDRAVCDPILLDRGFGSGAQGVAVWRRGKGEARAEISRFALWRLPEDGSSGGIE
jgi:serine/threonine protein kinase